MKNIKKRTFLSLVCLFMSLNAQALRLGEKAKSSELQSYLHLENCGAVKVDERAFLTAAHCAHQELGSQDHIKTLKSFTSKGRLNVMSSNGQKLRLKIESVHYHPSYLSNARACERKTDCIDMALVILSDNYYGNDDFNRIPDAEIAPSDLSHGERIRFTGSGHESFIYKLSSFLSGVFNISNMEDQIPLHEQNLKEYAPKTYFLNDHEIAIYPETISFFSREAPILLNGDSGAPLFNSKGQVIGINSYSDVLTGRSVAKKVHAKVSEPVLEWIDQVIEREDIWPGSTN